MFHALIIEDEALIAFQIADVIELAGVGSIAYAQMEVEAISAAMERKPDIIVSDVMLLTGNGPNAMTSIRLRVGRIPAVFITGNPEVLAGYDHDGLMEKPFQEEQLRQMVTRLVANC